MKTAKVTGWILTGLVVLFAIWLVGLVFNIGLGLVSLVLSFVFGLVGLIFSKEGILLLAGIMIVYLLLQRHQSERRPYRRESL